MAWVWRAWDPSLDRVVAIKEPILNSETSPEAQARFVERFLREGKAAAALNHPGIVTVYAAAVYDGRPVIVMELISGPTLRTIFRHGGLTIRQTYALMDQLLEAVGYAHNHRVVHRDLKPDNVFITPDGRVKLADFGVAQLDSSSMLTQAGTVIGTPAYMSPEQIRGEKTDSRSDVFSLGVVAYEALAGRNPFGNDSDTQIVTVMHRIVNEPVPALNVGDVPLAGPLADVVFRALEKDPANRFADAAEMRAAWASAYAERMDVIEALAGIRTSELAANAVPASGAPAETVLDEPAPQEPMTVDVVPDAAPSEDAVTAMGNAAETAVGPIVAAGALIEPVAAALDAPSARLPEELSEVGPTATVPPGRSSKRRWPLVAVAACAVVLLAWLALGFAKPPTPMTQPAVPSVVTTPPVSTTTTPSAPATPAAAAVSLRLRANANSVTKGGSVSLTIQAVDATGSALTAAAVLESRTSGGWKRVKSLGLSGGKAMAKIKPSSTTTYRARVAQSETLLASASNWVKVKVANPPPPPPKKKHVKPLDPI
jgi:serine/threonine-protein kinase